MARPISEKATILKITVRDMKTLNVYKKEYDPLINVYSDLMSQYLRANKEFEDSGYQYETETAAGGSKKSAIVATLEVLRKDIIAYSDRLCINPKANNIEPPKAQEPSVFSKFLQQKS